MLLIEYFARNKKIERKLKEFVHQILDLYRFWDLGPKQIRLLRLVLILRSVNSTLSFGEQNSRLKPLVKSSKFKTIN